METKNASPFQRLAFYIIELINVLKSSQTRIQLFISISGFPQETEHILFISLNTWLIKRINL